MAEFRMPALGAGMDAGRVIEWYVHPGDEVNRGDLVAMVETDKANIDVEIFVGGVVEELLVGIGEKVPVGTPLARIATIEAEAPAAAPTVVPTPTAVPSPLRVPPSPAGDGRHRVVSPLVRHLAEEYGLDLRSIVGTGRGGVITRADVDAAANARSARPGVPPIQPTAGAGSSPYARRLAAELRLDPSTLRGTGPRGAVVARDLAASNRGTEPAQREAAPPPTEQPPTPPADRGLAMRLAIARAMEQANREIPHYYLGETVDVESTLAWLAEINQERPPTSRILPAALVLKAVALALRDYPDLNGYWIDDGFRPGPGIHLGVAINLRRGGLLAPAIRDADQLSLDELMLALKGLVERTRSGGLRGSELTDPTITISNLGDTGVESIQGVITPPQVALVGAGRITERPWAIDGMLAVRRTIFISLAGDHRASDGHRGGRFLGTVASNLTRPETL